MRAKTDWLEVDVETRVVFFFSKKVSLTVGEEQKLRRFLSPSKEFISLRTGKLIRCGSVDFEEKSGSMADAREGEILAEQDARILRDLCSFFH
jgi:hypothetical protein